MEHEPARRIVVLGASAGGPLALGDVLEDLPADVDAAVVVVLHQSAAHRSLLPDVLARRTALPVVAAEHGAPLVAGRVYVAPPDRHLVFVDHRIALAETPARDHHRPSVDATFESAAEAFGRDTIAVVMTGLGSDGAQGAERVHARGGIVIAQSRALYSSMPQAAVATGCVDRVVPLHAIADAIVELVGSPA
jgi:two-component system chemotaxis response regulator CheB